MKKLLFLLCLLSLSIGSTGYATNSPSERAYKSHVFNNRAFGYKDKKIIFPADDDPACSEIFKEKSYSCTGSTITTLTKRESDLNFTVSTTKERARRNHLATVKDSLVENQNVCRYDSMFTPTEHHFKITDLDCNLLTKDLCEVFFDLYEDPTLDKKETMLDGKLFKRFYDIVTSEEYRKLQKAKNKESYESIFSVLNFRDGKNELSVNEHTMKREKYENAIKGRYMKQTDIVDAINGSGVTNFKELNSIIDTKYKKPGYFNQAYSACVPMYGLKVFKDQAPFQASKPGKSSERI